MKLQRVKVPWIVFTVAVLLIGMSGGATAASLITGADVKDNSLTSADIKDGTLTTNDIKQGGVNGNRLKGESTSGNKLQKGTVPGDRLKDGAVTSAKIKDGTIEQKDLSAAAQDSLKVIANRTEITPPNATYGGANVVDIAPSPINASNDNRTPMLTFTLDAGKYYMSASAQFFHLTPALTPGEDYGVLGTELNGVIQPGNSVSSDIPDTFPNPGQTTAAGIFTIPANNTVVTVVGSIRGTSAGQGGVAVEILKIG